MDLWGRAPTWGGDCSPRLGTGQIHMNRGVAPRLLWWGPMNALANAIEKLVADPRVRIAGPALAAVLVVGFLVMGTMAREPVRKRSTPVSVLPERPLDIPMMGHRTQTVSGIDAILAWQQPAPKPAAKAKPASAKAKPVNGTLTARR